MHVSTNRGLSFDAVQLPAVSEEQFYSILDANENMIFMHVDDDGDTGKGTIFTSDEDGIIFSVSLQKNLYPNGDDVTDFVRVESLNGVYVTSQFCVGKIVFGFFFFRFFLEKFWFSNFFLSCFAGIFLS